MTNRSLATSYLLKARKRLLVLELLLREEAYSDVVREAQELVELALKALLRHAAIEPPKWHDVSDWWQPRPGSAKSAKRRSTATSTSFPLNNTAYQTRSEPWTMPGLFLMS